jgi:hypothetical protein
MNKFNYAEHIKLGRDSRKVWEQKLLDEQITQHDSVLNAIKDLETEKNNIERNHDDSFRALVEVYQCKITNMDTRGINQCEVYDLERLRSYQDKIIFKVTSTASDWWALIQVSRESGKNTFKHQTIELRYDPACFDTMLDVKAFQEQIQDIDFQVFMDDINNSIKDYSERASILSTQANALINKIGREQTKDRRQIMSYLISELYTNGLKRPSGGRGIRGNRRFVVTQRQNGEDGYYMPWHIKLLDKWRFDGEPSWDDTTELECEVTFRKTLYDMDYNDVGYQTQSGKVKIDAYHLYKWVKDLFIYQLTNYSISRDYGDDYYNRAIEELKRTPYLDTSTPYEEGHYSLFQNKKDRAVRDSFGEWVKVPKKGLKIDEAGKITKVVEA